MAQQVTNRIKRLTAIRHKLFCYAWIDLANGVLDILPCDMFANYVVVSLLHHLQLNGDVV